MKMARLLRFVAVVAAAHGAWVGSEDGSFRPSWMSFETVNAASEFLSSTADSIVAWARDSPLQRDGRRGGTSGAAHSPVSPLVEVLLAKLQHLRVTELVAGADADALGALAVDADWLEAAGLFPGQRVELGRVRAGGGGGGGARAGRSIFTTVRAGARGSGVVSLEAGAAAELAGGAPDGAPRIGDRISVAAYGQMTREQYAAFKRARAPLRGERRRRGRGRARRRRARGAQVPHAQRRVGERQARRPEPAARRAAGRRHRDAAAAARDARRDLPGRAQVMRAAAGESPGRRRGSLLPRRARRPRARTRARVLNGGRERGRAA